MWAKEKNSLLISKNSLLIPVLREFKNCGFCDLAASKPQRLRLLHLGQRLHLGEDLRRDIAIHLDQRHRIGARRLAADMERRDIDAGLAEHRGEAADETGLVEIGDVEHGSA